ncbi:hypothetical protein FEZ30_13900 [Acidipropionibacterium acidipropionici]|nr:hypothetical protein FEZ30_13900 [Acidipropionibacterium acidipropionici]
MDQLTGGPRQPHQHRLESPGQVPRAGEGLPHPHRHRPQPVLPRLDVLLDEAAQLQSAQRPVAGRLGDPDPLGEFGQAQRLATGVHHRRQELGLPVVPGAVTPGEIMAILATGIDLIKFFPASVYGGLKAIKALSAPFPQVRFIPTGGINADNMTEWLSNPAIAAIGGSWMVPAKAIDAGDFDTVRDLCAAAAATAAELDKKA